MPSDNHRSSQQRPDQQGTRPINAPLYIRLYELWCWARWARLYLGMGLAIAVLAPFAVILFPFLVIAPPVNLPAFIIASLLENRRARTERALLELSHWKNDHHWTLAERRRSAVYRALKQGERRTRADLGSVWTDRLVLAIQALDNDGLTRALAKGASPTVPINGRSTTPLWVWASRTLTDDPGDVDRSQATLKVLLNAGATLDTGTLLRAFQTRTKHGQAEFFILAQRPGALDAIEQESTLATWFAVIEQLDVPLLKRLLEQRPSLVHAVARCDASWPLWSLGNLWFGTAPSKSEPLNGSTALHALMRVSDEYLDTVMGSIARDLLRQTPSLPMKEQNDQAHRQAEQALQGTLDVLIEHGVDLEQRNAFGRTPLHQAVVHGAFRLAHRLLDLGVDPWPRDTDHRTPLDLLDATADVKPTYYWTQHADRVRALRARLAQAAPPV